MRRTITTTDAHAKSWMQTHIQSDPLLPGAEDALRYPSRTGNRLHYRDGRVTDMAGQPIKTSKVTKGAKE